MTLAYALHLFERTRHTIAAEIQDLTDAQLLRVPDGFANNIAWNIGHVIALQQSMIYERSGLPAAVELAEMKQMYWGKTSPADWTETPDPQALLTMFMRHPAQLRADVDAGKFTNVAYAARTSGSGVQMQTVVEAMHYNNTHEALHRGAILALKDFVTE